MSETNIDTKCYEDVTKSQHTIYCSFIFLFSYDLFLHFGLYLFRYAFCDHNSIFSVLFVNLVRVQRIAKHKDNWLAHTADESK